MDIRKEYIKSFTSYNYSSSEDEVYFLTLEHEQSDSCNFIFD